MVIPPQKVDWRYQICNPTPHLADRGGKSESNYKLLLTTENIKLAHQKEALDIVNPMDLLLL